jgi:predicted ATP-binding protein involved in virulence
MLLKTVEIINLFGIFNHKISLFEDGISIVIGENGVGKTYILDSINSFFNMKYNFFKEMEYEELIFSFQDETEWRVSNINKEDGQYLHVWSDRGKEDEKEVSIPLDFTHGMDDMDVRRHAQQLSRIVPHVERISSVRYFDQEKGKVLRADEVVNFYSGYINHDEEFLNTIGFEAMWLFERVKKNSVYLIQTQRVYNLTIDEEMRYEGRYETRYFETITKFALDLKDQIVNADYKYSQESSKRDESFPYRLINKIRNYEPDTTEEAIEKISNKLIELEDRRTEMKKLGLLINEDSKRINKTDIDLAQDAIELYIDDSNEKFNVYASLQEKIKLFTEIINKRFNYKKIRIDKEKGFIFIQKLDSEDLEKEIPINKLSSGEKNELIMFYELLFKSNNENLILIDEPEISLHISWQNLFIEDLKSIHNITGINVLIATHSPDIIGINWDLTNDLGRGSK